LSNDTSSFANSVGMIPLIFDDLSINDPLATDSL
ncbi:MAG: hypothetical protein ACI9US_004449, partial [Gammaproteobacteria bacterium]